MSSEGDSKGAPEYQARLRMRACMTLWMWREQGHRERAARISHPGRECEQDIYLALRTRCVVHSI